MKKINTLLSFLIAFSFVTVAFGQDDDALTRTTPVISSTGGNSSGSGSLTMTRSWGVVNVNGNTITLKLTKSVDCALLKSISAWSITPGQQDAILNISYNPNDLKKLQVGVKKPVVIKLLDNFADKKVMITLDWDLKGCNDNALGMKVMPKTQMKSMVAPIASPTQAATPTQPANPSGSGSYSSNDSFFVILKADGKTGQAVNNQAKAKDKINKTWND
jgi:hypothetical protein